MARTFDRPVDFPERLFKEGCNYKRSESRYLSLCNSSIRYSRRLAICLFPFLRFLLLVSTSLQAMLHSPLLWYPKPSHVATRTLLQTWS